MAFNKTEIKQLEKLFEKQEKKFDEKLDLRFGLQEKKFDEKLDEKIDSLALITKKGFDDADIRFNILESRMDNLEQQFKKHEANNFANFDMISRDIRSLQRKLEQNPSREEMFDLEKRVTIVEEKVGVKYNG